VDTSRLTDKHRLFYVNDVLEFALFYDPRVTDKETIIKTFLDSKEWKFYEFTYEIKKVKKAEISEDLKIVKIIV
jgi:hypothetical protein